MVWQTYDYYFEPTAAYFGIKKACEPLHIQWNPSTDQVEVVNYSAGFRPELTAYAQILNMDASVAWEKEVGINSEEDTTQPCIRLEFPNQLSKVHFIKLTLREGNKIISENFYLRSKEENNYQDLKRLPNVSLQTQTEYAKDKDGCWTAIVKITNPSRTPALLIRLNLKGDKDGEQILPVFYSDNYFALMPGEQKEVRIRWQEVDTRGNGPQVEVSGYNVKKL